MLDKGSVIWVQLPGTEDEVKAVVTACSKAGRSCKLLLDDGDTVTVNISKCNFSMAEAPNGKHARDPVSTNGDHTVQRSDTDEEEAELDVFRALGAPADGIDRLAAAVASGPDALLQPSEEIASFARAAAKELIDYAAKQSAASAPEGIAGNGGADSGAAAPAALYVEGFDAEQIWLQLDMLSAPALKKARKLMRKAEGIEKLIPEDVEEALDDLLAGEDGEVPSDADGDLGSMDEDGDGGSDGADSLDYDAMLAGGDAAEDDSDDESSLEGGDDDLEEDDEGLDARVGGGQQGLGRRRLTNAQARAAVEDDFMKLDEMEAFLQAAERAEAGEEDEEELDEMDVSDSDVDDDALDPEGGGVSEEDDEEEAALEALLDNAVKAAGQKKRAKKRKRAGFGGLGDSEDEDGDDDLDAEDLANDSLANARYEDFFGPRKLPGGAKRAARPAIPELSDDDDEGEDDLGSEYDEEEEGSESEGDEDDGALGRRMADYDEGSDSGSEGEGEGKETDGANGNAFQRMSSHQRRMARAAEKVKRLEAEAMGERDWHLMGEVVGTARPKNSALEIDMEFETTVKPPPAPTEESTRTLEELIRARIAEGRFDDVPRTAPPPPDKKRTTVELDDKKSAAGLGELYEADYVAAVTGTVDDRDEPVRELAKAQFAALCAKLDQLSHGHFRPAPSIEEVTVKVDVPAILMEEAAPAFVSAASMRAPEEVYRPGSGVGEGEGEEAVRAGPAVLQPGGGFKSEAELSREDRKRRRAAKKRAGKKHKAGKEAERAQRAEAAGKTYVPGRKSEEEQQALRKLAKASKKSKDTTKFTRSAAVFAQIQAKSNGAMEGAAGAEGNQTVPAARLKL